MTEPEEHTTTGDLIVWLRRQLDADEQHGHAIGNVLRTRPATAPLAGWLLRDVAAKRAILDLHNGEHPCVYDDGSGADTSTYGLPVGRGAFWCPTQRLLASAYADCDGYRPEWGPQ